MGASMSSPDVSPETLKTNHQPPPGEFVDVALSRFKIAWRAAKDSEQKQMEILKSDRVDKHYLPFTFACRKRLNEVSISVSDQAIHLKLLSRLLEKDLKPPEGKYPGPSPEEVLANLMRLKLVLVEIRKSAEDMITSLRDAKDHASLENKTQNTLEGLVGRIASVPGGALAHMFGRQGAEDKTEEALSLR
eukprot:1339342-Amorphochlora_amoeboformis.AAC.1